VILLVPLLAWLVVAYLASASGLLSRAPVPPPAIAIVLAAAVLLLVRLSRATRQRLRAAGLRPLVAFHLVRIAAGAYFLLLYQRGQLPASFAIPAGWGDIAVGVAALPVLWWCVPIRSRGQRLALLLWNTLGLIDILGVLVNAARLFLQDAAIGAQFSTPPLALLPTFVVPVVLVSHLLLFAWSAGPAPERAT
jgi:hypothetical protein